MTHSPQDDRQRLRKFAAVMAIAFALLAGLLWWRGSASGAPLGYVAAAFLLAGLVAPRVLAPIERAWMALARVMGAVMTTVILTLTFFLVITPMGLLVRLLGKDLLAMRRDPGADTYWVPMEPDGPTTRPDKPY